MPVPLRKNFFWLQAREGPFVSANCSRSGLAIGRSEVQQERKERPDPWFILTPGSYDPWFSRGQTNSDPDFE
jgi:hypothetical protein